MQINVEIQEEKIKKQTLSKLKSVRKIQWKEKKSEHELECILEKKFGLNQIISKLLVSRGIDTENFEKFSNPLIKNIMPDPHVLDSMECATKKIVEFIIKKKKIGLLGDYDVDGSASTAIMCSYLKALEVDFEFYIPDRIEDGYGPSIKIMEYFKNKGCELIITLDCGTSSLKEINYIKKKQVDVIVVDHHKQGKVLPDAFAIINPNKKKDNSNLKNLCAAGVVFFLLASVNRELKQKTNLCVPDLLNYLDLVALATVCDLVKLDLMNRAFVKQGLKILNNTKNDGLLSLINESGIKEKVSCYHLGYVIGPRINAGGRVGKSSKGTELLISSDKNLNFVIAKQLNEYNTLRKKIELQVEKEAIRQVDDNANVLCVNSENWHPGVIGIVASKLVEKFNKPSIVISENIDLCKASCRSVNDFDIGNLIIEAVEEKIIETGGGHKMAGGFSVKKDKITELKKFLKDKYNPQSFEYTKYYDYDLKLSSIDMNLYNEIQKISPFGIGNSTPKFLIRDCIIKFPRIVGEKHLSCIVSDIYKNEFKSIAFNAIDNSINDFIVSNIQEMFSLIVTISKNTWLGQEKIELRIEDVINS